TSSIPILEISVWASPDSLTSGTLVTNELVALDLTMCEEKKIRFFACFSRTFSFFCATISSSFIF
ncbi:hypothetical protein Q7V66_09905, partial [Streptococcus suis]|nr:hypothetical protein [Streptococcus suis]